jgi:WD40 repeat protein
MAAGSFDGEVLIYDLADSCDVLKACSNISDYSHREPVSSLQWNRNRGAFTASIDAYQLVSLSSDGKILWWSLATIKHATAEISGHLPYPVRGVTLACNPELTLLTNMAASSPIVGGTSMALAESCVMIGSEGGKILRCHPRKKNIKKLFAGSDSNIHWDKSAIDFFDNLPPCITSKLIKHVELWANSVSRQVVSAKDIFVSKPLLRYVFPAPTGVTEYEGHVGPITMISMSPFHRRVFLSVGVDGYAKLWSTMQRRALMTMRDTSCIHLADGLYASGWSKARPLVFAVAGDGGVVRVHDLGNRRPMLPVVELKAPMPASANDTDRRILALQFNHKQRNFLATGNAAGHVHVWRLSWRLSNQSFHEHEKLQSCIDHMEEKGA